MTKANPIKTLADGAEQWASVVFAAVKANQPDDPDDPPVWVQPNLKALASWNDENAVAIAIKSTSDQDARKAIIESHEACKEFARATMAATFVKDIGPAIAQLNRKAHELRRYAGCVMDDVDQKDPNAEQSRLVTWPEACAICGENDKRNIKVQIRVTRSSPKSKKIQLNLDDINRVYGPTAEQKLRQAD